MEETAAYRRPIIEVDKISVALEHRQGVLHALRRCAQRLQAPPNYIAWPSRHFRPDLLVLVLRVDQITEVDT